MTFDLTGSGMLAILYRLSLIRPSATAARELELVHNSQIICLACCLVGSLLVDQVSAGEIIIIHYTDQLAFSKEYLLTTKIFLYLRL